MTDTTLPVRPRLIVPALGSLYSGLSEGVETLLRVVAGLALVTHGASKIANPFGAAEMVEGLGFYPGVFGRCSLVAAIGIALAGCQGAVTAAPTPGDITLRNVVSRQDADAKAQAQCADYGRIAQPIPGGRITDYRCIERPD